jgi:hypothetical protein
LTKQLIIRSIPDEGYPINVERKLDAALAQLHPGWSVHGSGVLANGSITTVQIHGVELAVRRIGVDEHLPSSERGG